MSWWGSLKVNVFSFLLEFLFVLPSSSTFFFFFLLLLFLSSRSAHCFLQFFLSRTSNLHTRHALPPLGLVEDPARVPFLAPAIALKSRAMFVINKVATCTELCFAVCSKIQRKYTVYIYICKSSKLDANTSSYCCLNVKKNH